MKNKLGIEQDWDKQGIGDVLIILFVTIILLFGPPAIIIGILYRITDGSLSGIVIGIVLSIIYIVGALTQEA